MNLAGKLIRTRSKQPATVPAKNNNISNHTVTAPDPELLSARPWIKFYDTGVPQNITATGQTLPELLRSTASKYFDRTALIFFGGKLTFRELDREVDRFANGLADLGVLPGDRVALVLPNCPQFVIAYFGALRAGAIVVPCNPLYVDRELEHQLKDSGATVVVTLTMFYKTLKSVQSRTDVRRIIVGNIKDYFPIPLKTLFTVLKEKKEGHRIPIRDYGTHNWLEFLASYTPSAPRVNLSSDSLALYQYTGGTTGSPKGAMLTHSNLVCNAHMCLGWMGERDHAKDLSLSVLPFFHVYGMTVGLNLNIAAGITMLLVPKFSPDDLLKLISKHRPTLFPGVPAMYIALLNHPDLDKYHLDSIDICLSGASPLPVEIQTRFERETGAKLVEGFGMTECSPVSHCTPVYGKRKNGSIGIPVPGMESRIVDIETGDEVLPAGATGELVIKGPTVMQGYYKRGDESAKTVRDGWLYTGDIGYMDEDGFFYIVDRKKDMILSNGFNVYPREVEEILFTHWGVKDAVVIGAPNERGDTTVKAFVILKDDVDILEHDIIEFCRVNMARYKAPRVVEFRKTLPKTLIGKPLRRVLVEEELQKLAARHNSETTATEEAVTPGKQPFRLKQTLQNVFSIKYWRNYIKFRNFAG